jgi:hypothetical protein
VKVLLTSLPPGVTAKMLRVTIQPYQVEVRHRVTGEVYLEGDLERGVVPEDSCWVMEEEGLLLLLLAKMNLELYERWGASHVSRGQTVNIEAGCTHGSCV